MAAYTYQYFLLKDTSTYYVEDGNGNIIQTGVETPLRHAPLDWAKMPTTFKRDPLYLGTFLEITPPVQFVEDGANILRSIWYDINQGTEGNCILRMKIWNPSTGQYEQFYDGDIDFSNANDKRDFFLVTIANRGLQEQLTSRQDIEYPIDLNVPVAETMLIDGMFVKNKGSWYPGNYSEETSNTLTSHISFATTDNGIGGRSVNLTAGDSIDQPFPFIRAHEQGGFTGNAIALIDQVYDSGNPLPTDGQYLFYTNSDIKKVVFDAKMKATVRMPNVAGTKHVRVRALVVNRALPSPSIESATLLYDFTSTAVNTDEFITFNINATLDSMPAKCYLVIVITGQKASGSAADENAFFPIEDGYFNVTFQAKVSPTETKCLRYIDAAQQLISQISDGNATVFSSMLNIPNDDDVNRFKNWDTSPYYQYLTNGKSIRGLVNPATGGAFPMTLTFKKMFSDLFSTKGIIAMVENGNLKLEPLRYAFDDTLIAIIPKVNNIEIVNYDKLFNSIQAGYDYNETNNTLNGQNAFNTTLNYICDKVTRVQTQQSNLSPFIADPTVIERIRGDNLDNTQSGDTNDNDVFIIEADPITVSGKRVVYRPSGTLTGIDDPVNVYNDAITSGRCARVLLPWYRSIVPVGNLIFQLATQTDNLISTFVSGTVVESDSLPLGEDVYNGHDVRRLFLPRIANLDCEGVFLFNAIRANPRGYLQFDYYGTPMKGFIINFDFIPETGECKASLSLHPSTDLTLLRNR